MENNSLETESLDNVNGGSKSSNKHDSSSRPSDSLITEKTRKRFHKAQEFQEKLIGLIEKFKKDHKN